MQNLDIARLYLVGTLPNKASKWPLRCDERLEYIEIRGAELAIKVATTAAMTLALWWRYP